MANESFKIGELQEKKGKKGEEKPKRVQKEKEVKKESKLEKKPPMKVDTNSSTVIEVLSDETEEENEEVVSKKSNKRSSTAENERAYTKVKRQYVEGMKHGFSKPKSMHNDPYFFSSPISEGYNPTSMPLNSLPSPYQVPYITPQPNIPLYNFGMAAPMDPFYRPAVLQHMFNQGPHKAIPKFNSWYEFFRCCNISEQRCLRYEREMLDHDFSVQDWVI